MPDPITATGLLAAAAAGGAGNLLSDGAKRAVPVLWRGVSTVVHEAVLRALPQARRQFEANAEGFVAALADEVARGNQAGAPGAPGAPGAAEALAEAAARKFGDPDVAVAVADALRTAGRTSSAERHRTLAKLVAARLASDGESAPAVAANHAVRVVETLGPAHLQALALLALTHYVGRPNPASPAYPRFPARPPAAAGHDGTAESARRFNEAYGAWTREIEPLARAYAGELVERLRRGAERVGVPDAVPAGVAVHLVAAACAIRHESAPELAEACRRAVAAPPPPGASAADCAPERAVETAYFGALFSATRAGDALGRLAGAWTAELRHLALTPAGLLIGLAALDVVADEHTVDEWRWAGVADHALALSPYVPVPEFDARWARDNEFQAVLQEALTDLAGRGKLARVLDGR